MTRKYSSTVSTSEVMDQEDPENRRQWVEPGNSKKWYANQRVALFVDVQNLYYSARNLFDSKISYLRLLEGIIQCRQLVRAIAYVVEKPGVEQEGFYEVLRHAGYEIRAKVLQERSDGTLKGNWDMGIAIDALTLAPSVDCISLVSGDGGFLPLVETLRFQGKRVEVVSFDESVSDRLVRSAHEFIELDESYLID